MFDAEAAACEKRDWEPVVHKAMIGGSIARIYIAGPMSGLPNFNYDAFHHAAKRLRSLGVSVVNPAENGLPQGAPWAEHMRIDLQTCCCAIGSLFWPGWEKSSGANLESKVARVLGFGISTIEEVSHPALTHFRSRLFAPEIILECRRDLMCMLELG